MEKTLKASLLENKISVAKGWDELAQRSYGKPVAGRLELSFVEALYLLDRKRIAVAKSGKKVPFDGLMEFALSKDRRIHEKFIVYSDLRSSGLVAKTGFKFGCDFRVYQRGVGVRRGPKEAAEHTKWIVFAVPEDYRCSFAELSRAVRLAHSIRARMLWAIVDNEDNVTYYEVVRMKP
jgi:tRNA-intron endonuclease